jgi:hypothetical protein
VQVVPTAARDIFAFSRNAHPALPRGALPALQDTKGARKIRKVIG